MNRLRVEGGQLNMISIQGAISGLLNYLMKRINGLMVYMKILTMPTDNSACERGFKPFVKCSKTSLFF